MQKPKTTVALALALALTPVLAACGPAAPAQEPADQEPTVETAADQAATPGPADLTPGTYECEVKTDSSMFRAAHCTLEVADDGSCLAHLALPGEGFSRLFYGTAEEAAGAPDDEIYDYYLGDDGLYTFDVPVAALDEDLTIAAFGQRRDRWYDHTINFATPAA